MEAANALVHAREGGVVLRKEQRIEIASNDAVEGRKLAGGEETAVPGGNV